MDHCIVHIDGGARGNPGPAGAGIVLVDADDGVAIHEAGHFLGRTTNNVAEYEGLVRALELAASIGVRRLTLHSDSQLLVRQLTGQYRVKSAELRPLFERAQSLLRRFERWSIEHVRREHNARADALANRAMDAQTDVLEADARAFVASRDQPRPVPGESTDRPAPERWKLRVTERGTGCPADHQGGESFTFGATTPAGCCVHAAAAAFEAGALQWSGDGTDREVRCARCRARLTVTRP